MKTLQKYTGLVFVFTALSCYLLPLATIAQAVETATKQTFTITAEIDNIDGNYILRGIKSTEVYTILNPQPKVLKPFIVNRKPVQVEAQIVSGDNVNITTLNGTIYP